MMSIPASSRQPYREPWTIDRLNHERSILLGLSIDSSTATTYSSATNSYLTFCKIHNLSIDPTPDTLSYYITFQSHFISPDSVDSYLSGISNQLEPFYPDVRRNRASPLVRRTMKGARRSRNRAVQRKSPLTVQNLAFVHDRLAASLRLDDLLFDSQINTGFSGLLRLGEMVSPDKLALRDWKKVTMRHTLEWLPMAYSFWLPRHKGDMVFEGNRIVCRRITGAPDPLPIMRRYIENRDRLFPLHPQLWLRGNGTVPLRSWWIARLRTFFKDSKIAGQSMRAGGATALAEAGAVPDLIMGSGRWGSQAWTRYVRKNPVLLHALILSRTNHYDNSRSPLTFA